MSEISPNSAPPPSRWLRIWQSPIARLVQYGLLAFALILVVVFPIITVIFLFQGGKANLTQSVPLTLFSIVAEVVGAIGALWLMSLLKAGPSLVEAGLRTPGSGRGVLLGFFWGALLAIGLGALVLLLRLAPSGDTPLRWRMLAPAVLLSLLVGVAEETIFRGFTLPTLERAWGTKAAWVISSLLFGALHLTNPGILNTTAGATAIFVSTAAGGLILGASFLLTRRLWFPIGLHAGWDAAVIFASGKSIGDLAAITSYDPASLRGDLLEAAILVILSVFVFRAALRRQAHQSLTPEESGKIE